MYGSEYARRVWFSSSGVFRAAGKKSVGRSAARSVWWRVACVRARGGGGSKAAGEVQHAVCRFGRVGVSNS